MKLQRIALTITVIVLATVAGIICYKTLVLSQTPTSNPAPSLTPTPIPPTPTPTTTPKQTPTPISTSPTEPPQYPTPNPTPIPPFGTYEKSIVSNVDNAAEGDALTVAENINYTGILKVGRFYGYNGTSYYGQYTWAQYVDKEVINYYNERFESLKGQSLNMTFNYTSTVYTYNQINVVQGPNALKVLSSNGTVLFEGARYAGPALGMKYFCLNDTGYQQIQAAQINFNFSSCYLVEMKLKYSEDYAILAAFISDNYQIVFVDEDLNPIFLCVQARRIIS